METKQTAVEWLVDKLMKESTGYISLDALVSYTKQALEMEKEYTNSLKIDENKLYSDIEHAIITWTLDGTRTAGSLTREIMLIIKQQEDE
jgi:hypothetical protein